MRLTDKIEEEIRHSAVSVKVMKDEKEDEERRRGRRGRREEEEVERGGLGLGRRRQEQAGVEENDPNPCLSCVTYVLLHVICNILPTPVPSLLIIAIVK